MKQKYIVIPGNSDLNRGDQALIWESVRLFQECVPSDSEFYLLESGDSQDDIARQTRQTIDRGFPVVGQILLHPGRITKNRKHSERVGYGFQTLILWGAQAIIDLVLSSLLLSRFALFRWIGKLSLNERQNQTLSLFQECEGVIVKGGGFLHAYGKLTDPYVIYYQLFYLRLAHRLNKPVYVLPNSFGPFRGFGTRRMLKRTLRQCKLLTARENVSLDTVVKTLGIDDCKRYPDLGFFLEPSPNGFKQYLMSRGVPLGSMECVAVTLRPYRFPDSPDPHKKYANYIDALTVFVTTIVEQGYHVVFAAHTLGPSAHEDDRLALKNVMDVLPDEVKLHTTYICDESFDCQDVMKVYSYMDYLIGTRFHSVIFAMGTLVPSMTIAYGGNKGLGIMRDAGLEHLAVRIEDVSAEKLQTMFTSMCDNRDEVMEKMRFYRERVRDERAELKKTIQGLV